MTSESKLEICNPHPSQFATLSLSLLKLKMIRLSYRLEGLYIYITPPTFYAHLLPPYLNGPPNSDHWTINLDLLKFKLLNCHESVCSQWRVSPDQSVHNILSLTFVLLLVKTQEEFKCFHFITYGNKCSCSTVNRVYIATTNISSFLSAVLPTPASSTQFLRLN